MDKGPSNRTDNSPGLAEGLVDKLDKRSADDAGLDKGPSNGTDDNPVLAKGLAELEER